MDSNLHHQDHFFEVQQEQSTQEKQMGSGLMRYQSAPSSYLSTFLDKVLCDEFLNRPTSPETERFFERLLENSESFSGQESVHIKQGSPVKEAEQLQNNSTGFVPVSYPSIPPQPRPPPPFSGQNSGSGMDYRVVASMGMERLPQPKVGFGATSGGSCNRNSNSTLVRHSSSPAGFFSNINIGTENVYPVMRGMGDYGNGNRHTAYSAASRPPHPSSGRMSPIVESGSKNTGENGPENVGGFGESRRGNYVRGFPMGSWDDSSTVPPAGGKGFTDDDRTFSGLNEVENQKLKGGEAANAPRMLARHFSLQNTSSEMAALEKILQLQDSVPCKIRAKRGCATHPRSIAERVRRTRISERMRKLQELVPNMDKQTNTADMLDLAVDYIKDLQRQVKILSENRANCKCTKMQQ